VKGKNGTPSNGSSLWLTPPQCNFNACDHWIGKHKPMRVTTRLTKKQQWK